jgi:hypothetical protein
MKYHEFDSTAEAYDASQCDDNINSGDVLIVKSERVVGVLVEAWPVAVTEAHGTMHALAPGSTWAELKACYNLTIGEGIDEALALAKAFNDRDIWHLIGSNTAPELEHELAPTLKSCRGDDHDTE